MRLLPSSSTVRLPVWLMVWSIFSAITWLLPVHMPPWSTFPADAWAAVMLLIGALVMVFHSRLGLIWHEISCLVAAVVFLPWLQLLVGLLPFAGQAWMSSGYLLGFLLALLIGARWELCKSEQLISALFLAIGLAAIGSVGLQLYTWLDLSDDGVLGLWALGNVGSRPSANLGQPNQLATLLVWGLLACFWAYLRRLLSAYASVFIANFLLVGLALTQSRTGFLAVSCVLFFVWFWRRLWPSRTLPWVATGLYLYLLCCPTLLRWLNAALLLGQEDVYVRLQQQSELRLSAWRLFLQAILEKPIFGYGWTEVTSAQMAVADQFSGLGGIFLHSHNLFLDLLLWNGLPIGLLIVVVLIRWYWLRLREVLQPEDLILILLLVVIGIHALLEFPLQYAYFLLPSGLFMGVLNTRLGARVFWVSPNWTLTSVWLAVAISLGVTIRDYAQVDASYSLLRLEQGILGQGRGSMGGPPDVWVLTQMREWIRVQRFKAHPGMSQQELDEMATITRAFPSLSMVYRLATAYTLNDQPEEARAWLRKICKFTTDRECRLAKRSWEQDSLSDGRIASISWPK